MAKRNDSGDSELNLDSLMDAVTNVVGVLMIVFVMMALNTARTLQKVLSELPNVTEEQLKAKQQEAAKMPPPPADPLQLQKDREKAEQDLKKVAQDLKTIDTSEVEKLTKFMDLEKFRKELEKARKDRESQRSALEKLFDELEKVKALLAKTPEPVAKPPSVVRMPNPRPFPEGAVETRVMVAAGGVVFFNQQEFLTPLLEGLQKAKAQFAYREVKIDPFAKMLQEVYGNANAARAAWPLIAEFAPTFQLDQVALAHKVLAAGGLTVSKGLLEAVGNLSLVTRATMPTVAEAIVALAKGDSTRWKALDPSRDPAKPIITVNSSGGKLQLGWGSSIAEMRQTPKDVADYFAKTLGDIASIKKASETREIVDAFKLVEVLERAAASPMMKSASMRIAPKLRPGTTSVVLDLSPQGGNSTAARAQFADPSAPLQRQLRQIKADAKGVAVFQVMKDAFETYLDARRIADEIGVPATWEFLTQLELTLTLPGFEVQRFAVAPPPAKPLPPGTTPVRIAPPKRTLD